MCRRIAFLDVPERGQYLEASSVPAHPPLPWRLVDYVQHRLVLRVTLPSERKRSGVPQRAPS